MTIISIHALLAESDGGALSSSFAKIIFLSTLSLRRATPKMSNHPHNTKFLSTLSLRRATNSETQADPVKSISIHALLAESDPRLMYFWPCGLLFLSTLSLRRATQPGKSNKFAGLFLSTLSLRRATREREPALSQSSAISIHALLAESDKWGRIDCGRSWRFLSTLSLRRATG